MANNKSQADDLFIGNWYTTVAVTPSESVLVSLYSNGASQYVNISTKDNPEQFITQVDQYLIHGQNQTSGYTYFNLDNYEGPLLVLANRKPEELTNLLYQRYIIIIHSTDINHDMQQHSDLWNDNEVKLLMSWRQNDYVLKMQSLIDGTNLNDHTVLAQLEQKYNLPLPDSNDSAVNQALQEANNLAALYQNHWPIDYLTEYHKRNHVVDKWPNKPKLTDEQGNSLSPYEAKTIYHQSYSIPYMIDLLFERPNKVVHFDNVHIDQNIIKSFTTDWAKHLAKFYQPYNDLDLNTKTGQQRLAKLHQAQHAQYHYPIFEQSNGTKFILKPEDNNLIGYPVPDNTNKIDTVSWPASFQPVQAQYALGYWKPYLLIQYLLELNIQAKSINQPILPDNLVTNWTNLIENAQDYDHDYYVTRSTNTKYSCQNIYNDLATYLANHLDNYLDDNLVLTAHVNANLKLIADLDKMVANGLSLLSVEHDQVIVNEPETGLSDEQVPDFLNVHFYAHNYLAVERHFNTYVTDLVDGTNKERHNDFASMSKWPLISTQLLAQYLVLHEFDLDNYRDHLVELLKKHLLNPAKPSPYQVTLYSDPSCDHFILNRHEALARPLMRAYLTKSSHDHLVGLCTTHSKPAKQYPNPRLIPVFDEWVEQYQVSDNYPDLSMNNLFTTFKNSVPNDISSDIDYRAYLAPVDHYLRELVNRLK